MLSPRDREMLKETARSALQAAITGRPLRLPEGINSTPALQRKGGAFVTLRKNGELRGCIGTFESGRPLVEIVLEMAEAAGMRDPRFPEVTAEELEYLDIEISVLGQAVILDSPEQIELGKHGLIISSMGRRGVLLPQVPIEWQWDRLTFLEQTCKKAGLPKDAWKDSKTRIEIFEAEAF